jgi:hypothetical protein
LGCQQPTKTLLDRFIAVNPTNPTKDLAMTNNRTRNIFLVTIMHLDGMVWVKTMQPSQ